MEKPKWATKIAYKIVKRDFTSSVAPGSRFTSYDSNGKGKVLRYQPGTVVDSPNGLCLWGHHECCRGIHAYKTLRVAKGISHMNPGHQVIRVYSNVWIGDGHKIRTWGVFVGKLATKATSQKAKVK